MPDTPKPTQLRPGGTVVGGGIGAALGVLVVEFLPATMHTFTPESASVTTAAFGIVFSYLVRYLPAPKR